VVSASEGWSLPLQFAGSNLPDGLRIQLLTTAPVSGFFCPEHRPVPGDVFNHAALEADAGRS